MAVTTGTVWEIQSGGSANNSGGFDSSYGGTDYTQTTTPTCSGITIILTGTGTTATLASSGYTGVTADLGNVCNVTSVTSGTATVGHYTITAVTSTQWTFIGSIGTAGAVIVVYVGGCKSAPVDLINTSSPIVAGNIIYSKGAFTTNASTISVPGTANIRVVGYGTTRGDGTRSSWTLITNTGLTLVTQTTSGSTGWEWDTIKFDGGALGTSRGFNQTAGHNVFVNCELTRFTNSAIIAGANTRLINCDVTSCSTSTAISCSSTLTAIGCKFSSNSITVFLIANNTRAAVISCLFYGGSGATSDYIQTNNANGYVDVINCTFNGSGRHGVNFQANASSATITNCLFTNNTSYGISTTATNPPMVVINNAFYVGSGTGATTGLDSNRVMGSVTLTGDPYNAIGSDDYRLDNTSSEGAACRNAGYPSTLNTFSTYRNIGAFDVSNSGGSGGLIAHRGMTAGLTG